MPQFIIVKDKIKLCDTDPDEVLTNIANHYSDVRQDVQDGLKLIWQDRWVHISKSNTELIIRIYAEGKTENIAIGLVEHIRDFLTINP